MAGELVKLFGEQLLSKTGAPSALSADLVPADVLLSDSGPGAASGGIVVVEGHATAGRKMDIDSGQDNDKGSPNSPALKRGRYGPFRLPLFAVHPGTRTVTVKALQPVAEYGRPRLVIKANPAIGIAADVVVTGTSSTTWQTLTSGALTITAKGGLRIELWNLANNPCWFDTLAVA